MSANGPPRWRNEDFRRQPVPPAGAEATIGAARSPPLGFPGTRGAGSTPGQRLPAKAAGSRKTVWPDAEMHRIDAFTYGYHDDKERRRVSIQKFPVSRVFCV